MSVASFQQNRLTDVAQREHEEEHRPRLLPLPPLPTLPLSRSQRLARKQCIKHVLPERPTQPVGDLSLAPTDFLLLFARPTHLERIENDVELDRILPADRMVHLARVHAHQ